MESREKEYFEKLHSDRMESADMLEKPSMRGIKNSVVEKYSDQAHFIYELIQNADDAKATKARFFLEENRLIFIHNGTRHFSVSDPEKEDFDSTSGYLGDINAITSIANSNKTQASIGKFGVGFKAVFQYTSTPYIFDPNFKFKIERFIVPTLLEKDFPGRGDDETVFVFPFDHTERPVEEAYEDIKEKLKNLSYPLLFLSTLNEIKFNFADVQGEYKKSIEKKYNFQSTVAEKLCLINSDNVEEKMWLFSRSDSEKNKFCVGFFLDEEDELLPKDETAFCFFPTKEVTGLKFIIHAPFLLTDSREGIRAGIKHNDKMIRMLATLAADALEYLKNIGLMESKRMIKDNILSIIPVDQSAFSDPKDKRKISFLPFYEIIKDKMATEKLLPTLTGYACKDNAYWASVIQLNKLFSNEQLSKIVDNVGAEWVFTSIGRDDVRRSNKALCAYIDDITKTNLNEESIINGRTKVQYYYSKKEIVPVKGITDQFIEEQEIEWLHLFYKWISETSRRIEMILTKPIFLDQNKTATAAFDSFKHPILFLPDDNIQNCKSVYFKLMDNDTTLKFLKQININKPSLKDYIYNTILPQYANDSVENYDDNFMLFFRYFCKCSNENVKEFIELIKECKFLEYHSNDQDMECYDKGSSLYIPNKKLKKYFESKPSTRFINIYKYEQLVGEANEKSLQEFLKELGVKNEIRILKVQLDEEKAEQYNLPIPYHTRQISWEEPVIDGCEEIVREIVATNNKEKSVLLWENLLDVIRNQCGEKQHIDVALRGACEYFYHSLRKVRFDSTDVSLLKKSKWILNSDDKLESAENLCIDQLSAKYDRDSEQAEELIEFLNIAKESPLLENEDNQLSDEQKEKIALANRIVSLGFQIEDIEEFKEYQRKKALRNSSSISNDKDEELNQDKDVLEKEQDIDEHKISIIKDLVKQTNKSKNTIAKSIVEPEIEDQDEFMPLSRDYSSMVERAKEKSVNEIEKIVKLEELQERALKYKRYSYGWFTSLLEMEMLNNGDDNLRSKEVSISFERIEREKGTMRTLILKNPNRNIPQFMEELSDIPLILHFKDQTKSIPIEVASIKSYTLRVKAKSISDIENIDFKTVVEATIDAKSPIFLLNELLKAFKDLKYDDDFDMQQNLCENIEFIFGPPGTGKTTYLAKNILIPIMQNNESSRVLVLTPTNKAADVLVNRIIKESGDDKSYNQWLTRFGITGDETIENSEIFRNRTFDIRILDKSITVTTIARFPYDYFMPAGVRLYLSAMNWDYIVIDEASMIPLANIIYPLFKKTPKKFIIAGDPFQIEPITSVDLWKDENIYSMVQLHSFLNPKTIPYQYKVELLTTQYRSIPAIGRVYSEFAYGGILKHYRTQNSQKIINFGNELTIDSINILKFPVKKYESIYKAKRLQHSSAYQIYSALFTYEYVCYISELISKYEQIDLIKIGIIAPYRAQADLIEKLISRKKMPEEVEIYVGTIHGFQGDECDIIFAVLNTPPSISTSKNMFLNKKNIINVSISRAKDYLFLVMPDDNTEKISNLLLVKQVEKIVKDGNDWVEILTPKLEKMMFKDEYYLENNTFTTSHQNVNIYDLPEKKYEIRTEENALDIQVHN